MQNRIINIAVVAEVAEALKDLKQNIVFVGGAVVSLYADDPASDEIRPTQDVDLALNIINLSHWKDVQEKLGALGFHPDPFGHAICSYRYKDIQVDIMATDDDPFGSSNSWYKPGFKSLWSVRAHDQEIKILSAPYYLATKFEAFNNRSKDYRTSHDIEDIVYVIDNRISIIKEVTESDLKVRSFLIKEIQRMENKGLLTDVLMAHIHPLMIADRLPLVEDKLKQIMGL